MIAVSENTIRLNQGVEFSTSNGGTIKMVGNATGLFEYGVTEDGWAYYDDLRFNPYSATTLNLSNHQTQTSVIHSDGKVAASFRLISLVPNGKADIHVRGLAPGEWYRLEFGSVMAETEGGMAHGKTSESGDIQFNGVAIPNE